MAWFGTYDRAVGRNAILVDGLRAAGCEVVECHAPLWPDTDAKLAAVAARDRRAAAQVARRQVAAWRALGRRARRLEAAHGRGGIDAVVVGPTAHLDLPLARRLADRHHAPLVFDPLISARETARDRGLAAPGGARDRLLGLVERALFALPDLVLVDTAAHGRALAADLGLDAARAVVVPVGAPRVYRRATPPYGAASSPAATPGALRVVYAGQYIPLHGVDVILAAAAALRHRPAIRFTLVGRGQGLGEARRLAARLGLDNVRFVADWLPPDELAAVHLAPADVCLGVFGTSPKAAVVVPHKVYMALAAGRAVVTGDTPAARELLGPDEVARIPPGDPAALAAALTRLADDPAARARLAAAGGAAWEARYAPEVLGRALADILAAAARAHRAPRAVGPRHRWRVARLARALDAAAPVGARLDAGCGEGSLALALAGSALDAPRAPVLACDRAPARVARAADRARARGLGGRILPFVADLASLPLTDGAVAGAAAGEVLEHVGDDVGAARELARVLAPGGALAVSVPAGPGRLGAFDRRVGHLRRYDAAALRALLEGARLELVRLVAWGVPFGRLYDRAVQRPALAARGPAGRIARRLGGGGALDAPFRAAFALDTWLEGLVARAPALAARASGLLAVARKRGDVDSTAGAWRLQGTSASDAARRAPPAEAPAWPPPSSTS